MCNACGFLCCAMDCFSGCGCEWCPDPECFDDTNEDYQDDDGDYYDMTPAPRRRFFCDSLPARTSS